MRLLLCEAVLEVRVRFTNALVSEIELQFMRHRELLGGRVVLVLYDVAKCDVV